MVKGGEKEGEYSAMGREEKIGVGGREKREHERKREKKKKRMKLFGFNPKYIMFLKSFWVNNVIFE